jgi:hypothetical protein
MSSLDRQQTARLIPLVTGVEQLLTEVDEEGAEEILDELYMLITKLLEQFPQLDKDEE